MIKDIEITVAAVFCDRCGKDVHRYEGWPYHEEGTEQYCPDCAYKLGKMSKKEWCRLHGICLDDRYLKNLEIVTDEG